MEQCSKKSWKHFNLNIVANFRSLGFTLRRTQEKEPITVKGSTNLNVLVALVRVCGVQLDDKVGKPRFRSVPSTYGNTPECYAGGVCVCLKFCLMYLSLSFSLSLQGESPEDLFKQPVVGRPKFPSHISLSDASGQGRQRSRRLNDMSHGTIAHDSQ